MMNPKVVSAVLVSLLLAASMLCVGVRRAADEQRKTTLAVPRPAGFPMDGVVVLPASAGRKEADARGTKKEALASRLRSVFAAMNPAERDRELLALAEDLSAEEWPEAMVALIEMGMRNGGAEQLTLLSAWVEKDVAAAMAWAEKNSVTKAAVLREWAGEDPDGALNHLLSIWNEDVGAPDNATIQAAGYLATDPQRLARLIGALSEHSRRFVLSYANPVFAAEDQESVEKWLRAFDPALRGQMLEFRMKGLSRFEDKSALARAFSDDMGPEHYGPLYKEWATADKEAATAALNSMDPGPIQRAAHQGVVVGLFEKRRMAESVEVLRAYPEYANEGLIGEMLLHFNLEDAELLMTLVPEIKQPDLRINRYWLLLSRWLSEDAPAARKWMDVNEVPEQVRRQLAEP